MKRLAKLIAFIMAYLLICQILLPIIIPKEAIYNYRIKYDIFKNNPDNLDAILDTVEREIREQGLKDYVILMGDSVGYSTPADEYGSLGYYMNQLAVQQGYKTRIFNLSIPSEYPGDVYTLIKLLDGRGISTAHLIINFNYFEFSFDEKYHSVFWLKEQLKAVDQGAYNHVFHTNQTQNYKTIKKKLSYLVNSNLHLLSYKDYIRARLVFLYNGKTERTAKIQPWYEKKYLQKEMRKPANQWYYTDKPFVMDESRAAVYFINKIIAHQKGKDTLIFLQGFNRELLRAETEKEGFNKNLNNIDAYFKSKRVDYINFDRKIEYKLYSDHIHLIPEGYAVMAAALWSRIKLQVK